MQTAGLYTGLAGIGFVLHETYVATGDTRYRDGARRAVTRIHEQAREVGAGVEWIDSTDILSGSAGTGLFLIYAADRMEKLLVGNGHTVPVLWIVTPITVWITGVDPI